MPTPEVVPAPATLRRRTSPNCEVNELITPTPFEPSVTTPTKPRERSIDNLVAFVRVLNVTAVVIPITDGTVDAVPIVTKVSPTATTGLVVIAVPTVIELPAETPVKLLTKIMVEPAETVELIVVVKKLTFAARTVLGEVNANATLFVI